MAPCVISLCSDWPLRLLRFRFHNAQSKCAPVAFKQLFVLFTFTVGRELKNFKIVRKTKPIRLILKAQSRKTNENSNNR